MRTEARRECVVELSSDAHRPTARAVESSPVTATGSGSRPLFSFARLLMAVAIASSGLAWDLWSKSEVFSTLGCPGVRPIWKGQLLGIAVQFHLETTFNHGALWGMGQGQTWLFASLSFFAIGVIAYFLWNGQATTSVWLTIATGLLLAGTLGNLFDRMGLHGWRNADGSPVYAVRDFLDFWFFGTFHWATFNFADTYLVTGAIMLVVHSLFVPSQTPEVPAPTV